MAGNQMPTPDVTRFPIETRYQSALNAMRNPGFLKTPKYQQQQKRALTEGAHPHIVEFARKIVKRFHSMGVPMFPHCIVRTEQEQQSAFDAGVSWDSPTDGLWPHKFGAVDIIHGTLAWMDRPYIPHAWQIVGHVGQEVALSMGIKIVWGGDFSPKKYDPAHFDLANWKQIATTGDKYWSPNHQASA